MYKILLCLCLILALAKEEFSLPADSLTDKTVKFVQLEQDGEIVRRSLLAHYFPSPVVAKVSFMVLTKSYISAYPLSICTQKPNRHLFCRLLLGEEKKYCEVKWLG